VAAIHGDLPAGEDAGRHGRFFPHAPGFAVHVFNGGLQGGLADGQMSGGGHVCLNGRMLVMNAKLRSGLTRRQFIGGRGGFDELTRHIRCGDEYPAVPPALFLSTFNVAKDRCKIVVELGGLFVAVSAYFIKDRITHDFGSINSSGVHITGRIQPCSEQILAKRVRMAALAMCRQFQVSANVEIAPAEYPTTFE